MFAHLTVFQPSEAELVMVEALRPTPEQLVMVEALLPTATEVARMKELAAGAQSIFGWLSPAEIEQAATFQVEMQHVTERAEAFARAMLGDQWRTLLTEQYIRRMQ